MSQMEDIRAMSADQKKEHVAGLKKELFNLRFQVASGEAQNTARFREVRVEIARTLTAMNESNKTKAA